MLSDLLKALELLVKVIQGGFDPSRRRQGIGKKLVRLHLDTESVVEAGEAFLDLIESAGVDESGVAHLKNRTGSLKTEGIRALRRKQIAIEKVIRDFDNEDVRAILGIKMSEFRPAQFIKSYEGKQLVLGLLLSQFTENDESSLLNSLCEGHCSNCDHGLADSLNKKYGTPYRWSKVVPDKDVTYDPFDYGFRLGYADKLEVVGLPEHIEKYKHTLSELRNISGQLRLFLRDNFSVEELV